MDIALGGGWHITVSAAAILVVVVIALVIAFIWESRPAK